MLFLGKIKIGYFKEKYRFQSSLFDLIFLGILLLSVGLASLISFKQYFFVLVWIIIVATYFIISIRKFKALLLYEDFFVYHYVFLKKGFCEKISYNAMQNSYVHIAGVRGQNNFTFNYILKEEKYIMKFAFAKASKTVQAYRFLLSKGVKIYADNMGFAESIYETSRDSLLIKEDFLRTWYYGCQ